VPEVVGQVAAIHRRFGSSNHFRPKRLKETHRGAVSIPQGMRFSYRKSWLLPVGDHRDILTNI
jgi:hypothetical protein